MNSQSKRFLLILMALAIVVVFVLWFYGKVSLFGSASQMQAGPQQLESSQDRQPESAGQGYVSPYYDDEEEIEEDAIDTEKSFRPMQPDSQYSVLSLGGEVSQYASSGLPLPNTSMYNVNTRSYITGLGDPIRGDLDIKPMHNDIYKSKYSARDARVGALSSMG